MCGWATPYNDRLNMILRKLLHLSPREVINHAGKEDAFLLDCPHWSKSQLPTVWVRDHGQSEEIRGSVNAFPYMCRRSSLA